MRLGLKSVFIFVFFLFAAFPLHAAEPAADSCEDSLTKKWVSMLDDLNRVETFFMESKWRYLKYWETVYNPLWQAQVKKDDQLSEKRKAEGEVLFSRYQGLAEDYLSLAEESDAGITERLTSLRNKAKAIPSCCSNHDYRQCMSPRGQDILERVDNLEKMLQLRKTTEIEFSARVRSAVNDRPSDHDEFSSRFQNYLQDLEVAGGSKILFLLRDLRESLEINWPGQKCCEICKPLSADIADDPVLNRLKPDRQGESGADGRIVNNASIVKAFEKFEESKKKKVERQRNVKA